MAETEQEPAADSEREQAIAAIFSEHHTPLVRLSTLLGADDPEDIVGEAFYQLFRRWRRLRDTDSAVAYLRSVVCNLTRMRIRHLQVARKHLARSGADPTTAHTIELDGTGLREDQRELLEALKELPSRQREALVLRYWLDLREVEIADAMNISAGAVKSHASRGMTTLTKILEERRAESPRAQSDHMGADESYSGKQKQSRRVRGR
jgi:RNA polymerase sigma factor (sigma-70 family)